MRATTLILAALTAIACNATSINRQVKLLDGSEVAPSHIFVDGDDPSFTTNDGSKQGWNLYICTGIDDSGEPIYKIGCASGIDIATFTMYLRDLPWVWNKAMRIPADDDASTMLFKAKLELVDRSGTVLDELPLTFSLLPSALDVTDVKLQYQYDWKTDNFVYEGSVRPLITFTISKPERTKKVTICLDDSDVCPFRTYAHVADFQVLSSNISIVMDNNGQVSYICNWAEYVKLSLVNDYGSVSRYFYVADYLTDPEVIARTQQVKQQFFDTLLTYLQPNASPEDPNYQIDNECLEEEDRPVSERLHRYDVLRFRQLRQAIGLEGTMKFYIATEADEYTLAAISEPRSADQCYYINPEKLDWSGAYTFTDSESGEPYFKGKIEVYRGDEFIGDCQLTFDYRPYEPKIEGIEYYYEYDWANDCMSWSVLNITAKAEKADKLILYRSGEHLFTAEDAIFETKYGLDAPVDNYDQWSSTQEATVTDMRAEWGTYYRLAAVNDYGITESQEIICTTDLITDPDIKERIEYLSGHSSISAVSADSQGLISVADGRIVACGANLAAVEVYALDGSIVIEASQPDIVSTEGLTSGIYIIKAETDTGSKLVGKFVKK